MSKRRLLADSGDEDEEAARAPQRPDKATAKQPPAKVAAAKGAAVASANHLHSPLVQLLEKCGLKVSSNGATPHSGSLSTSKASLTHAQVIQAPSAFCLSESCAIATLRA